jgi:phytoene dehydrogenase-like protein
VVSLLRPEIIRELDLRTAFTPLEGRLRPGGDYLWRVNDHGRTVRELRRWSKPDAEAYEEYGQLMVEMAKFIKPILGIVPPDLTGFDPRQFSPLTGLLRAFQKLPEKQQAVFVQLMTMSATDFLRQWFETDPLIATMSASGIIGTYQGVQSPGTAYVLLHHYMGEIDGAFRAWGIPRGGTGGVSNAIGAAAQALGAEIRLEAPVARIDVHRGRAVGVVLESGEEIRARTVISSVDARLTYLGLIEPGTLEPEFEEEVRRFKFRGSSGKVNLAVDRLPDFACLPGEGDTFAAQSASAPASTTWSGRTTMPSTALVRRPYIDMIIPTLVDPSMAPPGKHVISCFVQYAP